MGLLIEKKFSEGPWEWTGSSSLDQSVTPYGTILEKGCCGGYDSCGGFIEWGPNKEADMRLIVAAPDMYEALNWCIFELERHNGNFDKDMDETMDFDGEIKRVKLALAKVEGSSDA